MSIPRRPEAVEIVMVSMGQWAVAAAPIQIRTLLGSCAGVVLHDRLARLGGVAHIVLPESRGSSSGSGSGASEHPGKYADTAIPGMIDDLDRLRGRKGSGRLTAKIVGGASMFQSAPALDIGQMNRDAVEQILGALGIPVLARDVGGGTAVD